MPLESPAAAPESVVPLLSGGMWLGADARLVAEILGASAARRLAGAHEAVLGVIAWRGRAVSVVDIARLIQPEGPPRLGSGGSVSGAPRRLVVVQDGAFLFAIGADVVREVQAVDPAALSPVDARAHPLAPRRALLWDERSVPGLAGRDGREEREGREGRDAAPRSEPGSRTRMSVLLLDLPAIGAALEAGAQLARGPSQGSKPPPSRNGALRWSP